MSDESDTDLLPNNVLTFQRQGTTVCARGPNINSTSISSLSFRNNNVMTSTMNGPWGLERRRYAESVCEQRSKSYRERETSPMSFHSASGMQPRNFHHSYYPSSMKPYRSAYNGRSGSPMSVRTIDSNTSMSAKDIVFAFQNGSFNKFELKTIKDAYNRLMKSRVRKRVEKRRNVKMFLKGFRRRSGGDSGDQASDSSVSSDDCRSTRTSRSTIYRNQSSCRSTKTDISEFRRRMIESDMVKDCTDNFRQSSIKNMFSGSVPHTKKDWQNLQQKSQNTSNLPMKERFKSNFLLPSQRFNQSVASLPVLDNSNRLQRIQEGHLLDTRETHQNVNQCVNNNQNTDSEEEEIFGKQTSTNVNGKRSLEEDIPLSNNKKSKLSPEKLSPKPKTPSLKTKKKSEFVFAKPQLPIKKQTITKQTSVSKTTQPKAASQMQSKEKPTQSTAMKMPEDEPIVEKVISSSQKAVEKLNSNKSQPLKPVQISKETLSQEQHDFPTDITKHSTSDMSMRPSFIKRKLFTQKVDVAEKNSSSDSIQTNSPQTSVYSKIQKEKNRARKLVTNQSCLSRDVGENSKLLDLIHKIVPADRMNATIANKTDIHHKSNPANNKEKWDVTSVITNCKDSDLSDTFTDEDIFSETDKQKECHKRTSNHIDQPKGIKHNQDVTEKSHETQLVKVKEVEDHTKISTINIDKQTKHIPKKQIVGTKSNEKQTKKLNGVKENHNQITNLDQEPKSSKPSQATKEKLPDTTIQHFNEAKEPSSVNLIKNIRRDQAKTQNYSGEKSKNTNFTGNLLCKVLVEKAQINQFKHPIVTIQESSPTKRNEMIMKNIYKGVKSFWDTDAESDMEATPLKSLGHKPTGVPEVGNQAQIQTLSPVKNAPIKALPTNRTMAVVKKNNTVNQIKILPMNSKEKQPKNKVTETNKNVDKVKPVDQTQSDNNKGQKKVTKTKTSEKVITIKKNNEKIPVSRKENCPPVTSANNNTADTNVKDNHDKEVLKTSANKSSIAKSRLKLNNNNDSTFDNNVSSDNTSTVKIRAHRKQKVKKCCGEDVSIVLNHSHNDTMCRSLRSRQIDLSTSDECSRTANKKNTAKGRPPKSVKNKTDLNDSDISFTLAADMSATNRTLRTRKKLPSQELLNKNDSDLSFTLRSRSKILNESVSTRSNRKSRELRSLQNSSLYFDKIKKSPINKKIAAERASNTRLNRNSRLL